MNILFITDLRGSNKRLLDLAEYLTKMKPSLFIYFLSPLAMNIRRLNSNVKIITANRKVGSEMFNEIVFNIWASKYIAELERDYGIDAIISRNARSFFYLPFKNKLFIYACDCLNDLELINPYYPFKTKTKLSLLSKFERIGLNAAKGIFVESEYMKNEILKICPNLKSKIEKVYPGLDAWKLKKSKHNFTNFLTTSDEKIVLFVGDLIPRKGLYTLLDAIPMVINKKPNTKFVIVGREGGIGPKGGFKRFFLNKLSKISQKIIFTGYIKEETLHNLYERCDCFVSPSYNETFGWSIMEAFAHGKPIVSTPVGIAPEIILQGINGFLVPLYNAESLADSISLCLDFDESDKKKVSRINNSILREKFSMDKWARRFLNFLIKN